jgi:cation transport ATPase
MYFANTSDYCKGHRNIDRLISYPIPEKDHRPIATEDAAERGGGCIQTLMLTVHGMDSPSCARKVTRALLTIPSVQDVNVNIFTGQASLTYREGLVIPSDLASRVTRLTGLACEADDQSRMKGKYRVLRIEFQTKTGILHKDPVLPLGVVILKTSRTQSTVIFDVEYNVALIQPRSVLDVFVSLGGSFLPPSRQNATSQVDGDITSRLRQTIISAILCIPVVVFSWAPLQPRPILYGAISLFLATCIQVYVGAPLYSRAFHTLFLQHDLDMDILVALSSTIAYSYSLVAYITQTVGHEFSQPFFETPTLLLTLISLGELISVYSRRCATSVLDSLGTLQPDIVQMVLAEGTTIAVTHVDLVQPHDVLRVSPNTLIPTDGFVLRGSTQVDESALTGESLPVDKAPGIPLTAGTRNMTHPIDMEVSRVPAENTLAEFASLVARLQEERLPIQDPADRAASWLTPMILVIAVITFVIWTVVGQRVRGEHLSRASLAALRYMIAVLIVSCPCAIVLCVPMVIVITGAVAIREGVLFKVNLTHVPGLLRF